MDMEMAPDLGMAVRYGGGPEGGNFEVTLVMEEEVENMVVEALGLATVVGSLRWL